MNEWLNRLGKQTDFSNTGFLRKGKESRGGGMVPPAEALQLPHITKLKLWILCVFQRLRGDSVAALGSSGFKLAPSSGTLVFLPPSQCLFSGN